MAMFELENHVRKNMISWHKGCSLHSFFTEITPADSKILDPLLITNLNPLTLKGFTANCLSQCTCWRERSTNDGSQRKTEIILYQTLAYLQAMASLLLWICLILVPFILTAMLFQQEFGCLAFRWWYLQQHHKRPCILCIFGGMHQPSLEQKLLFWTHHCRLLPDPNCLLPSELLNRNDRSFCSF